MSYLFVHDSRLAEKDGVFYTPSEFNDKVNVRYTDIFGDVTFLFRKDEATDISKYIPINNSKVRILFDCDLKKSDIDNLVKKVDGVILRMPSILGIEVFYLAKKYNKKIYTEVVSDVWDSYWYHSLKGKLVAPVLTVINKIIIRKSDFALYVTEKYLQKHYPNKHNSLGCSDVEWFNLNKEDELKKRIKKIESNNGIYYIGTAAAINVKFKCHYKVIKALYKLHKKGINNFVYECAGNGSNVRYEKMVQKYGLQDNVLFLGNVSRTDMQKWLDHLDICIQPSNQEGLPRAVIEAMQKGVLCIGSNTGGNPELINDKYLFNKHNPFYAKKISTLLKNISKEDLILQAKENLEKVQKYSYENTNMLRNEFLKAFFNYKK